MGLIVDGPDINQSRWRYYGHGRFVVAGFMAIKGLSRSGAEIIIDERDRRGNIKAWRILPTGSSWDVMT
jgi:DNA polymerase III alpha subunit